jgi:hypothetical protein
VATMPEQPERQWNVQPGPDGPVEALTTFDYLVHWLHRQRDLNPRHSIDSLILAWCLEHPQYGHWSDPRGGLAYAASTAVGLDGGGFISVGVEERAPRDDAEDPPETPAPAGKFAVQILRLPRRALSWREASDLAKAILRFEPLVNWEREGKDGDGA